MEVYFDGDKLITRSLGNGETSVQPLNDREGARSIAKLDPLGFRGKDRIKVQFWIDDQCFLRINVEDGDFGDVVKFLNKEPSIEFDSDLYVLHMRK